MIFISCLLYVYVYQVFSSIECGSVRGLIGLQFSVQAQLFIPAYVLVEYDAKLSFIFAMLHR